MRRHFRNLGVAALLRRELAKALPPSDFGAVAMVMVVLALMISGGRRLRHLLYVADDPVVLRLCGLKRLPTPRTVGRWLGEFRVRHLPRLQRVNALVVARAIVGARLRRLTIDVDGSVVSTGQRVQWARRGFDPHRRKVPSYHPITAYEAQSGQILRVQNRPGNIHDGKASLGFLRALFGQLRTTLGRGHVLEFRMDEAFSGARSSSCSNARVPSTPSRSPSTPGSGSKRRCRRRPTGSVSRKRSFAEHEIEPGRWGRRLRVMIYRRRVGHETAKNFQLDLFDPNDGHYEYSAVATNKDLSGSALWLFMCGRGVHEKVYGGLKGGFAFDCVPSMRYAANSAWQMLSALAFNLVRGFQTATTAQRRRPTRKRGTVYLFETIHTLQALCLQRAGIVLRPGGYPTLDVGHSPAIKACFQQLDRLLDAA